MAMAEIGATKNGGVCRLALTELDAKGRDLFADWSRQAGCAVKCDTMGNMFFRRAGTRNHALPIASGSHLDSQATGGRFDGVYGVLAALEVIETLNDSGIQTHHPFEAVVWTNEEGARFTPAMIGSGVFSGAFSEAYAYARVDDEGTSFEDALKAIDYCGQEPCGQHRFKAHFELHIEQGPILESRNLPIGIVTGVQGIRWYEIKVIGSETHAGPSPMSMRRDPVPTAAAIISALYAKIGEYDEHARCTIGRISASPGSINTVPGYVTFSVDLRHPNADTLASLDHALRDILSSATADSRIEARLEPIWHSPPVVFDENCISDVTEAAAVLRQTAMVMVSGAGHDSVYVSRVAPTGMIFIPCKDGLSHNEAEDVDRAHVVAGGNVLLHAMLAHDRRYSGVERP
jgi:N-carbamoyl-L-amino-acid hydrolase